MHDATVPPPIKLVRLRRRAQPRRSWFAGAKAAAHVAIFIAACVMIFSWMTGGASAPLLWDDNLTQWYGPINYAFDELERGHFPHWNPYQWAGMRLDLVGYYGVHNPLMWLARSLDRMGAWDTLSIYALGMHALGAGGAYAVSRAWGTPRGSSVAIALLYANSPNIFITHNWYYVFNLFAAMPWTLACISWASHAKHCATRRRAAFSAALCMSGSFYLGNVQYAAYLCLSCGVVWLLLAAFGADCGRALGRLILACILTVVLSTPMLLLLAEAGRNLVFPAAPLLYGSRGSSVLLGMFFPPSLILRHTTDTPPYSLLASTPGLAWFGLAAGAHALFNGDRARRVLTVAGIALAGLALALGSGCVLGSYLPLLNRFRIAFKWLLLVPPLLLLPCAAGAVHMAPQTRRLFLSTCLAIAAVTAHVHGARKPYIDDVADLKASMAASPNIAHGRTVSVAPVPAPLIERRRLAVLRANGGTYAKQPSLTGYDNVLEPRFRPDMVKLFGPFWSEGGPLQMQSFGVGTATGVASVDPAVLLLLKKFAVDTLLVPSTAAAQVAAAVGGSLTANEADGDRLVSMRERRPLVTNAKGIPKRFSLHADGIVVYDVTPDDDTIVARWWALKGFEAEIVTPDRRIVATPLCAGDLLKARPSLSGTLHFKMKDPLALLAFFFSITIFIMILICAFSAKFFGRGKIEAVFYSFAPRQGPTHSSPAH